MPLEGGAVMSISTFSVLNVGVTALDAMQQGESVVANNIANANTPGYVQESAALAEASPYPPLPSNNAPMQSGQFGQGVQVAAINRQTSAFVNQQDRANQATYNMYSTHSQTLSNIEAILNEPSSSSLQSSLDQFFQSWQTLSTDPSNAAARQSVLSEAQTLGQTFQTVTTQLQQTQTNLGTVITGQLGELNQYASQVATLNQQITAVLAAGENPNQLLDQRGILLNKMAGLAGVSYSANTSMNGAVNVYIQPPSNGTPIPLVTGSTAATYPPGVPVSAATLQPQTASVSSLNPYLSYITSGSIAGNLQSYDDTSNVLSNLDAMLTQFANTVNNQQQQGYNLNSSTHSPALFAVNTIAGHVYLSLSSGMTPDQVGAAGTPNQPGGNSNALAMTQLQNQSYNFTYSYNSLATGATVNSTYSGTFDQSISQMVANIGVEAAAATSSQNTAQALSQQSSMLRQSISGVDQNQQAALMVEYQNSYNAAAKFISVFDQMLQTLISNV